MKTQNELTKALSLLLVMQEVFGNDLDEHSAQNHPGELTEAYYGCIADELRKTHDELQSYKICLGKNSPAKCQKAIDFYHSFVASKLSEKQFAVRYLSKKKEYLINKYGDLFFDDTYQYKGNVEKISNDLKALALDDSLRHAAKAEVKRSLPDSDRLLSASKRRELLCCICGGGGKIDGAIEVFKRDPLNSERMLQIYAEDKMNFFEYCKDFFEVK